MADAVTKTPSLHARDDCWTEDATATLIEAWTSRYLEADRRNLRQHHWEEVADAVNSRHGLSRTDIQCKNRIDTVKKKYKAEKARVSKSKGSYVSRWPFFKTFDGLFGSKITETSTTPPPPMTTRTKRQVHAAAEAASGRKREREEEEEEEYGEVAAAIERLGEIYERVERRKQREMVGLEKQRMRFVKELECHRMKMLVESELQIQKMNRGTTTKQSSAYAPSGLSSFMTLLFSD